MTVESDRLVPKVHPATRPVEEDDPMTLCAMPVMGDPDMMIRCLAEEYAWMGWTPDQILGLFRDPAYPALYALWQSCGEEGIRERVGAVTRLHRIFRFVGTVTEPPAQEEQSEPELVELGLPAHWRGTERSVRESARVDEPRAHAEDRHAESL
jgi:hypothetical protein